MVVPFFVIGAARSGTNLLARVLDRHPSCTVALDPLLPVFRYVRDAVVSQRRSRALENRYPKGSPLQDYYFDACGVQLLDTVLEAFPDIPVADTDLPRLRHDCVARAALESPAAADAFHALQGSTCKQLIISAMEIIADSGKACWCGCKEVWIQDFIPWLAKALPECRFVCIERDPRAVMASLLAVAARDPTQAAHGPSYMRHWRKGVALVDRYMRDPALAARTYRVRYEDLVTNPELEFRRLCQFMDLPYDDAMTVVSADGWYGNSGYEQKRHNIYTSSVDRWNRTLPREIKAAVEYLCGPELLLTPYSPAGYPRLDSDTAAYLIRANTEPCSWRSDSGDAAADIAWESLRHEMLESGGSYDDSLTRRCFLFPETYHALRSHTRHNTAPS